MVYILKLRNKKFFEKEDPVMKKLIISAAALFVIVIAVILVVATTKPDIFRFERTASIKAPPEKIFPLINDFHKWGPWSPYEKKDPAMKRTYSGAASGKGAAYEWEGNNEVGKGRVVITDTSPPSKVVIKLDMIKPFEGHNIVEFTLEPKGDVTNVTWAISGTANYISKVMCVFVNMDKMAGKDFEVGLASLKALAEKN
jgi:carbon monoxide dehydrogenase subunit G